MFRLWYLRLDCGILHLALCMLVLCLGEFNHSRGHCEMLARNHHSLNHSRGHCEMLARNHHSQITDLQRLQVEMLTVKVKSFVLSIISLLSVGPTHFVFCGESLEVVRCVQSCWL